MTGPAHAEAPTGAAHKLKVRRSGVDTRDEPVVYMQADCLVCRSEGFRAHARVLLSLRDRSVVATVHHVFGELFELDEAALSEAAWRRLDPRPGDLVTIEHPKPLLSMSAVRGKIYGERLTDEALDQVVTDLAAGRYSDIEASAFISACAAHPLNLDEIHALTRSVPASEADPHQTAGVGPQTVGFRIHADGRQWVHPLQPRFEFFVGIKECVTAFGPLAGPVGVFRGSGLTTGCRWLSRSGRYSGTWPDRARLV